MTLCRDRFAVAQCQTMESCELRQRKSQLTGVGQSWGRFHRDSRSIARQRARHGIHKRPHYRARHQPWQMELRCTLQPCETPACSAQSLACPLAQKFPLVRHRQKGSVPNDPEARNAQNSLLQRDDMRLDGYTLEAIAVVQSHTYV